MADNYPPTVQRPALLRLVEALGCRDAYLRRDACGDWFIEGDDGHIWAVPGSIDRPQSEGFQIFIGCDTVRQWSAVKTAVKPFTDMTNDGDEEGMLFLDHLPTPDEADILRRYCGLHKKREDSEATIADRNQRLSKYRFQPARTATDDPPGQG